MAGLSQDGAPMSDASSVSLSELTLPLRPVEAVTIVRELALRVVHGQVPGVPSFQVVRLCPSGVISVEGPVAADSHEVARAAHLLQTLLPSFDAGAHVPGALRLVLARAQRTLDLPPFASLQEFAETLSRFAAPDPEQCVRGRHTCERTRRINLCRREATTNESSRFPTYAAHAVRPA